MKRKLFASLLLCGAILCSTAAFVGCNVQGSNGGGGGTHTNHTYKNYTDNGDGTCTGTCTGCTETDTADHVYTDATDTDCDNCGHIREVGGETVAVKKVMLNKSNLSLAVNASETLIATVLPENATNKKVTWDSDDKTVATVDKDGKVEAKKAGTAVITVTTEDGNFTKTCTVTVTDGQSSTTVSVTDVNINKSALPLVVGGSETLTATVLPENATNKKVTWDSDNKAVATVDENGKVEAKKAGTAVITVTTEDGNFSKTCTVTVTDGQSSTTVSVTGVNINKSALPLVVGGSETLTATVLPENATNKKVTWDSDNKTVATVDENGKVEAKTAGTAVITVTTEDGNFSKTCTVTVTNASVPVTGVTLDKSTLALNVGDAEPLIATVLPATATNQKVSWTSSVEGVATVSASGDVLAKGAGTTTITVTTEDGGFTATCKVTVSAPSTKVNSVSLNKNSLSLYVNDSEKLTATIDPTNATNKNVTWDSSDDTVATVDAAGAVTAKKAGTATITVTTVDGGKTATCTVTVSNRPSASVDAKLTLSYAGEECAAFEWSDTTDANTKVEYKLHSAGDGSYVAIDSELIRYNSDDNIVRADVVGLKGGEVYDFRITTSSGSKLIATNMTIYSYDRSGFAHYNYTTGVGAYNDDGTLKDNAIVIYLTETNKNDIMINGKATGKSIAEYLASFKDSSTTSKIKNSQPIVIRVLGTVGAATWNKLVHNGDKGKDELYKELIGANGKNLAEFYGVSKNDTSSKDITQAQLIKDGFNTLDESVYKEIKGLNSKIKFSPKIEEGVDKSEFDSCWNDCLVSNVGNVTVEGIGDDARIFQWGFTWKYCSSIEVRNLTFEDYTEDACSFEGAKTSAKSESEFENRHLWVHHNTFEEGNNYWDVCNEQDKHDGDGSTDFKGLSGVTISYNVYHECHKTGLVGGSDSQTTANVTFHHNYYNNCGSRLPLARQATMHMYNNYYYNSTGTNMSIRAGGYALIENCYFKNANTPIEIKSGSGRTGAAKVINSTFEGKSYSANSYIYDDAKNAAINRASVVTNDNAFNQAFDTDSSWFYYDDTNLRTDVTQMMATEDVPMVVKHVAGVQRSDKDVTLAITGNNAVCGVKEGSGGSEQTKFEELSARGDCVYTNDFNSISNGTKFAEFENYNTAGIYSIPDANKGYANNYTEVQSGKVVQVTNGANTTTAIAFGDVSGKSSIEGYFEMSTSAVGSKWDLIKFVSGTSELRAAVRIHAAATDKLTYYTWETPNTDKDSSGKDMPAAKAPSKSFVWAAETVYKVYFTIDLTSGEIYINISAGSAEFEVTIQQDKKDICGIQLMSSNSGGRLVTIDNLAICAG